jgi:hypothetical protein
MGLKTFKAAAGGLFNSAVAKGAEVVGNALTGQTSGFDNQQGKVSAELLDKSPYEVPDSPQEKLKRNPLKFSTVQYPLDLGTNELGHYILFLIKEARTNKGYAEADIGNSVGQSLHGDQDGASDYTTTAKARKSSINETSSNGSVNSRLPGSENTTAAISIYMPPGIKVSYGQSYESESMNLTGDIMASLDKAGEAETSAGKVNAVLEGVVGGGTRYAKGLLSEAVNFAGAGDPVRLGMKRAGVAMNPRDEQFYNAPEYRGFEYTFDFWPRSKEELKHVQDIIFMFKYHSAPGLSAEGAGAMFHIPSKFEIQYLNHGKQNTYLNKIANCYCKSVAVDYGPDGQNSFFERDFKGASPVHYKMTVTFIEDKYITKSDILRGY